MKAAMQAAMELEGRLETLENAFEGLQQRFGTFQEQHTAFQEQHRVDLQEQHNAFREQHCALQEQHNALEEQHNALQDGCAMKGDVQGLEHRESVARQEMLVVVAQKADLEQLGQCLQAVRHELGEVVKRKANSELVESNLQDLRQELTQALEDQAKALQSKVTHDLSSKADQAESTQMQHHLRSLEVLANAAARRSELEELEQCVSQMQEKLPGLLQCKADVDAVKGLEAAHIELSQALQGKADTRDIQASMKAVRQEILVSLKCKVNSDYMEQRLQAIQAQQAQKQAECTEATEEKLSAALQTKADVELVDQRVQGMQQALHREVLDRKADCSRVEKSVEELEQRYDELTSTKADREKVVEIVEAVRDEVFAMAKVKPEVDARVEALEQQQSSTLRELSDKMNGKADEFKVEQRLRMIRQDVVNMVVDKADLDVVMERVRASEQSVTEQVMREVQAARQEFTNLISRKADMEVIEQRFDVMQQELGEGRPRTANGGSPKRRVGSDTGSTRCSSGGDEGLRNEALFVKGPTARRSQSTSRLWKESGINSQEIGSEGTTHVDSWSGSETATICDMEDWMDHRMKLVKNELVKLVDHKVDMDQVNQMREEITAHVDLRVDQRVQVAQQELSDYVDCRAQAVRKELQADVDLINQCIQQVERTVEAIQQDNPLAKMIRDANQAQQPAEDASCKAQCQRAPSSPKRLGAEEYSPDDLRTRRVRDLLTQLVIQPGAEPVQ